LQRLLLEVTEVEGEVALSAAAPCTSDVFISVNFSIFRLLPLAFCTDPLCSAPHFLLPTLEHNCGCCCCCCCCCCSSRERLDCQSAKAARAGTVGPARKGPGGKSDGKGTNDSAGSAGTDRERQLPSSLVLSAAPGARLSLSLCQSCSRRAGSVEQAVVLCSGRNGT
jgi:hypothetical protein